MEMEGKQTSDKFHLALIFHPFIPAYLSLSRSYEYVNQIYLYIGYVLSVCLDERI